MDAKEFQRQIKSGEIINTKKGLVSKALLQPELSEKITDKLIGNVKIKNAKKVDYDLNVIQTSIPEWRKTHPNEIYFDSTIEGAFYHYLKDNNIEFLFKEKIVIIDKFEYLNEKQASLTWQPDFQIVVNGKIKIIIDTKGYPNESFPVKLKILMHNYYVSSELPHIWFIKNKKMFPIAFNCINRVLQDKYLDGIETVLLFNEQKKKKK